MTAGEADDLKTSVGIRTMRPDEFSAVRAVAVRAFDNDAKIGSLLDSLRTSAAWEDDLSFVADRGGEIVGQVLYTHAWVDAWRELVDVLVLSPVGVVPEHQNSGIGTQLISSSLTILEQREEPLVFLEGHPGFYPRFGFRPGREEGFAPPSARIPAGSFMVRPLATFQRWMTGALVYPDAFWTNDAVGLRLP